MDHEKVKRINLNLKKEDWCTYKGECLKHLSISNDLCSHCCYKTPLDIPQMIEEYLKNGGR